MTIMHEAQGRNELSTKPRRHLEVDFMCQDSWSKCDCLKKSHVKGVLHIVYFHA